MFCPSTLVKTGNWKSLLPKMSMVFIHILKSKSGDTGEELGPYCFIALVVFKPPCRHEKEYSHSALHTAYKRIGSRCYKFYSSNTVTKKCTFFSYKNLIYAYYTVVLSTESVLQIWGCKPIYVIVVINHVHCFTAVQANAWEKCDGSNCFWYKSVLCVGVGVF